MGEARRVPWLVPDQDPLVIAFGEVVRALREERGLSQWELSDQAHVHRNTPGLIERGERAPSLVTIRAFAAAFGISAAELVQLAERRISGLNGG